MHDEKRADDRLVEKVICAIYGEDTLDGLGADVVDRMKVRALAAIAIAYPAGVAAGREEAWKKVDARLTQVQQGAIDAGRHYYLPAEQAVVNFAADAMSAIRSTIPEGGK